MNIKLFIEELKTISLITFIVFLIVYMLAAFSNMTFNPFEMSSITRGLTSISTLIISLSVNIIRLLDK